MDKTNSKISDSFDRALSKIDNAYKSDLPPVKGRSLSFDRTRVKSHPVKPNRSRVETPAKSINRTFENSSRQTNSFSPNIKVRQKFDPFKTQDFSLRLTPLQSFDASFKGTSPKGLDLSNSLNYTTVYLTKRVTMDKEVIEQFSPKAQYLEEDAIVHTVPYKKLSDFYEAKCIDNKHESNRNQMKYFIDRFQKMCKRRNFDLSDQSLGPKSAQVIADIIEYNDHFIKLNLSKNFIGDEGAKAIAKALKHNKTLIHVDLSSNSLTYVGAQAVFEMLMTNKYIVSICLNSHEGLTRNKLDFKGTKPILDVLQANNTLQIVNLAGAYITLKGCNYVAQSLENNYTIFSLNISNNSLGEECAQALARSIPKSSLEELYIANNDLGDDGAERLLLLFKATDYRTSLKVLDLSNNNITTQGANRLFDDLTKCFTLTKLILDNNDFGNKGLLALGGFIADNIKVTYLSMKHCRLGLESAHVIAGGLPKNKTLETLILSWNSFTDEGIKYLCAALIDNDGIKKLDFSGCHIHDEGGKAISDLLKKNRRIKLMELKDNTFYDESGLNLADAVKHNKAVMKMTLDRNPMSFKYKGEVEKAITLNKNIQNHKRFQEMEKTMRELREFEMERHVIEGQCRIVERRKNDAMALLRETQEDFKKIEQEEEETYNNLNQMFKDLRAEFDVLHEENEKLEFQRRKLIQENDIIDYNINCLKKEAEPELKRLEEQLINARDEVESLKNKKERELLKYKIELDKEAKEEAEIEARVNKRRGDIDKLKEKARQDLSKAMADLKSVEGNPMQKKSEPKLPNAKK